MVRIVYKIDTDLPMVSLWCPYCLSWFSDGSPLKFLWLIHVSKKVFHGFPGGSPMASLCSPYGQQMVLHMASWHPDSHRYTYMCIDRNRYHDHSICSQRVTHGFPMVFIWPRYVSHMTNTWSSMVSLRVPYVFVESV